MKKLLIFILAVILTACSSAPAAVATEPPAPTEVLPTQTPIVVVQTVVVESTPVPAEVQPTQVPPTVAPVIVNVVVPTTAPVDTGANTSASPDPNAPIALDNVLGKGVFVNLTISGNAFTLRCFPRELTFTASAVDPLTITDAVFYYRTADLQRLYPSEWVSAGEMDSDGNGNFTLVFSGEDVNPNLRLDNSYLDFQIVGLNRGGGRVDATQKIEGLIKYNLDCP